MVSAWASQLQIAYGVGHLTTLLRAKLVRVQQID